MSTAPKHYYKVELTRYVRAPEYGPRAYFASRRCHAIPFGKHHAIKKGKVAAEAAMAFANANLNEASHVAVWRMCGEAGAGEYLKSDADQLFAREWQQNEKETTQETAE